MKAKAGKAKASRKRSTVKDLSAKKARPVKGGRLIYVPPLNYQKVAM